MTHLHRHSSSAHTSSHTPSAHILTYLTRTHIPSHTSHTHTSRHFEYRLGETHEVLDTTASDSKGALTVFEQNFKAMGTVPLLGDSYNNWLPPIIIVFCVGTLANVGSRCLRLCNVRDMCIVCTRCVVYSVCVCVCVCCVCVICSIRYDICCLMCEANIRPVPSGSFSPSPNAVVFRTPQQRLPNTHTIPTPPSTHTHTHTHPNTPHTYQVNRFQFSDSVTDDQVWDGRILLNDGE